MTEILDLDAWENDAMAQDTKPAVTKTPVDREAHRQEIADALGVEASDPKVDEFIKGPAGADVIQAMREAAQRALDEAAAKPPATETAEAAAGSATVVPAAPEDNPFTGLTMDEIYARHWEWTETAKTSDGLVKTIKNEYIPDPTAPIGSTIRTTTTDLTEANARHVETLVGTPGQPTTRYLQMYQDGELTSSERFTLGGGTVNVVGADGKPAEPDVRAGIPGASAPGGDTGPATDPTPSSTDDATPDGTTVEVEPLPIPEMGRTYVDGGTFYQESWTTNPDGTRTYTYTRTQDGVTQTATTSQPLDSLTQAAGLTYGPGQSDGGTDGGDPMPQEQDDPQAGSFGDEAGGGGDEAGDPMPQEQDDPDAGSSGDEAGGGGDEEGDPMPAEADDPDAGSFGDEAGGGGDEETEYVVDDDYSSVSLLDLDPDAVDLRLAREAGDFGDPTDPNVNEAPAPDPTQQPGYGNTDPVGDPDVAMLSTGTGQIGFARLGGDFGDPTDPNFNEAPAGEIPDLSTMSNTVDDDGGYASFESGGVDAAFSSPFAVDGDDGAPGSRPGSDGAMVGFDDPDLGD